MLWKGFLVQTVYRACGTEDVKTVVISKRQRILDSYGKANCYLQISRELQQGLTYREEKNETGNIRLSSLSGT